MNIKQEMRRRTKYTIAGVVAIVAGFAVIYYFFLRGTAAGAAVVKILKPEVLFVGKTEYALARTPERTTAEVTAARERIGTSLSRDAGEGRAVSVPRRTAYTTVTN